VAAKDKKEATLPLQYQHLADIFNESAATCLPDRQPWDHVIMLLPNAPPTINCKIYPMTAMEDQALDEFIDEQLKKGYICPSKSPHTSSFFFIKKKDGKL
jgi:hypothetical protein